MNPFRFHVVPKVLGISLISETPSARDTKPTPGPKTSARSPILHPKLPCCSQTPCKPCRKSLQTPQLNPIQTLQIHPKALNPKPYKTLLEILQAQAALQQRTGKALHGHFRGRLGRIRRLLWFGLLGLFCSFKSAWTQKNPIPKP